MAPTTEAGTRDPADLLAELWDSLRLGQVPSDDVREWFCTSVAASVRRSESLEISLGLYAPGKRSLHGQLQLIARDHFLLEALSSVALDEVTDWARCKRLSGLVHGFMWHAWPLARTMADPPESWPTWQRAVFRAAQTGVKIPTTPRGLWDILKKYTPFRFQRRPATVLLPLLEPIACLQHSSNRNESKSSAS